MSSQKLTFDSLEENGWTLAGDKQHPLGNLQGKAVDSYEIEIISFSSRVSFGTGEEFLDISLNGLTRQLFQYLADLIPPAGHMMVEYDSPEQQDTADSLALGIPPIVTPLGYMLFLIGCGTGFKDWHFAEGGKEFRRI